MKRGIMGGNALKWVATDNKSPKISPQSVSKLTHFYFFMPFSRKSGYFSKNGATVLPIDLKPNIIKGLCRGQRWGKGGAAGGNGGAAEGVLRAVLPVLIII